MRSFGRWLVAGLVIAAVFGLTTYICGALVLPVVMADGGVRWGIAGALGVAVAALAALWGHSFATSKRSKDHAHVTSAAEPVKTTGLGNTSNKITGGTFHQPVIQARDISDSAIDRTIPQRAADSDSAD